MNKDFSIVEILESVDSIVSGNKYTKNNKISFLDRHERFTDKKNMKDKRDSETIIVDAEKSLDQKDFEIDIKSKMKRVQAEKESILNSMKKFENGKKLKDREENNFLDEDSSQNFTADNKIVPLILDNELREDDELTAEENNLEELEEENELEKLENNFVYANEKLKNENIKKEEKIKDQNILLDKFLSQERYSELEKNLKLYQKDNAELRKKIFNLSENETSLRLQLSGINLNENIEKAGSENIQKSEIIENEDVKKLNNNILILKEEYKEAENKLSAIKKEKEGEAKDIDHKVNFYREENAKLIIDKNDIERKLENTKNQLVVNEKNKYELKLALKNLNQILASSNIETKVFPNKIAEPTTKVDVEKEEKFYEKGKSNKSDESNLDYLVKEIKKFKNN